MAAPAVPGSPQDVKMEEAPASVYPPPHDGGGYFDLGVNDNQILQVATVCRAYRFTATMIKEGGPYPFVGHQYAYWGVQYSDGVRVWVKIPVLNVLGPDQNRVILHMMKLEGEYLIHLRNRRFRWSPELYYVTMESNNPLGHPYMIEVMLPGKRLSWTDTFPADKVHREKVLKQVARIVFELSLLEPKKEMPEQTPREFLEKALEQRTMDVLKGRAPMTLYGCFALRAFARKLIEGKEREDFVLFHEGLFPHNVFVDDDFNVTGVMEWGHIKYLPSRIAYRLPPFLHICYKQLPPNMPADWCEYTKEFLKVPELLKKDRNYFIAGMQYEHATRASRSAIGHLSPGGWEMMCWDLEHMDWNHMIFDAIRSVRSHQWMERHGFLVSSLPGFRNDGLRGILHEPDFWDEAWQFFLRNWAWCNPWGHGERTRNLLILAVRDRFPWEFVEIMLKDAFAPGPPNVDHGLDLW